VADDFRPRVLALQTRLPFVLGRPRRQHRVPRHAAVPPCYAAQRYELRSRQLRRKQSGNVQSVLSLALLETDDVRTLGGDPGGEFLPAQFERGLSSVLTIINRRTGTPEKSTAGIRDATAAASGNHAPSSLIWLPPSVRRHLNVTDDASSGRQWRRAWASGCSGGASVRLDAVVAEQVAQAVELTVHPQVLGDNGLDVYVGCPLVL